MLRQFVLAPPRGAQRLRPFRRARLSTDRGRAAAAVLTLRLYRILLRLARELSADDNVDDDDSVVPPAVVLLQPPLRASDWGASRYQAIPTARDARDVLRWWSDQERDDPSLRAWLMAEVLRDDGGGEDEMDDDEDDAAIDEPHSVPSLWVTPGQLIEAVRWTFRAAPPPPSSSTTNAWALTAVRTLQHQRELQRRTSVSVERGIRVVATTSYLGTQNLKPIFGYRIRVENVSEDKGYAVQLLGRTWNIQPHDAQGRRGPPQLVDAPDTGAVGDLPVVLPGMAFEYMSGTPLDEGSSGGTLSGCFHFARVEPDLTLWGRVGGMPVAALKESVPKFTIPVLPVPLIKDVS